MADWCTRRADRRDGTPGCSRRSTRSTRTPSAPGLSPTAKGEHRTWPLDDYLREGPRTTDWLAPGVVQAPHRTVNATLPQPADWPGLYGRACRGMGSDPGADRRSSRNGPTSATARPSCWSRRRRRADVKKPIDLFHHRDTEAQRTSAAQRLSVSPCLCGESLFSCGRGRPRSFCRYRLQRASSGRPRRSSAPASAPPKWRRAARERAGRWAWPVRRWVRPRAAPPWARVFRARN